MKLILNITTMIIIPQVNSVFYIPFALYKRIKQQHQAFKQ